MINQNRFYKKKIMLYDAINKNIEKKIFFFDCKYIKNRKYFLFILKSSKAIVINNLVYFRFIIWKYVRNHFIWKQ